MLEYLVLSGELIAVPYVFVLEVDSGELIVAMPRVLSQMCVSVIHSAPRGHCSPLKP
jgi:hypothetical protein